MEPHDESVAFLVATFASSWSNASFPRCHAAVGRRPRHPQPANASSWTCLAKAKKGPRRIPEIFSTEKYSPFPDRPSIMRAIYKAQHLRKDGQWRAARAVLEAINEKADKETLFVTEMVHAQSFQLQRMFPNITALEFFKQLDRVSTAYPAPRTQATFNAMLLGLSRRMTSAYDTALDTVDVAVRIFDLMIRSKVFPDHFTMSILFRMCAMANSARYLELIRERAQSQFDFRPDHISGTSLLSAYVKCGQNEAAEKVLSQQRAQGITLSERAYTSLIAGFNREGKHAHVVRIFREAVRDCSEITPFLLSGVAASCCRAADTENARTVLDVLKKHELTPSPELVQTIFHTAVRAGDAPLAADVLFLDEAADSDLRFNRTLDLCRRAISGVKRSPHPPEETLRAAKDIFARMESHLGLKPDLPFMNTLVRLFIALRAVDDALAILEHEIPKRGLALDAQAYNSLIRILGIKGELTRALETVRTMRSSGIQPDQVTYNTLLDMAHACGDSSVRDTVVRAMEGSSLVTLDAVAATSLLKEMRGKRDTAGALRLHARAVRRRGVRLDAKAYGLLLIILYENNKRDEAVSVFAWLRIKNQLFTPIYNVMLHQEGRVTRNLDSAEVLFSDMKKRGIPTDEVTYTTMVRIYCQHGFPQRALRLVSEIQDIGLTMGDTFAWSALIDGCGRNGLWEQAVNLLRTMCDSDSRALLIPRPTTACYNAALYAAGIHGGSWASALEVYKSLLTDKRQKPDVVTYSAMASIILKHRIRVRELGVVRDVVSALRQVIADADDVPESRSSPSPHGRRVDKVKLAAKVKRLEWILSHKQTVVNPEPTGEEEAT